MADQTTPKAPDAKDDQPWYESTWHSISGFFSHAANSVAETAESAYDSTIGAAVDTVSEGVHDAVQTVKDAKKDVSTVFNFLSNPAKGLQDMLGNFMDSDFMKSGLIQGVMNFFGMIFKFFTGLFTGNTFGTGDYHDTVRSMQAAVDPSLERNTPAPVAATAAAPAMTPG